MPRGAEYENDINDRANKTPIAHKSGSSSFIWKIILW